MCNDLYSLLLYDKYTDADIMNGNATDELLLYISNKIGNISFTPEFEKFFQEVLRETSTVFASNSLEIRRSEKDADRLRYNVAYNCYNSNRFRRITAFNAALSYYLESEKLSELNHYALSDYIRKTIDKEVIKYNSTQRKEAINEIKCVFKVKEKSEEEKEKNEKVKRAVAIVVAIFVLDNLLYLIFKNLKGDEEKNNKPKIEYNYNSTSSKIDDIGRKFNNLSYDYEKNEVTMEDENNVKL